MTSPASRKNSICFCHADLLIALPHLRMSSGLKWSSFARNGSRQFSETIEGFMRECTEGEIAMLFAEDRTRSISRSNRCMNCCATKPSLRKRSRIETSADSRRMHFFRQGLPHEKTVRRAVLGRFSASDDRDPQGGGPRSKTGGARVGRNSEAYSASVFGQCPNWRYFGSTSINLEAKVNRRNTLRYSAPRGSSTGQGGS